MILKQYYLGCLAHASYLLGDEATGVAAVVDPQRDIDEYVSDAQSHGLTISHVFLTHLHADFLAGHLEIRERTGAAIYMGDRAKADFPLTTLGDGEAVRFGSVRVEALATPGHTPEGVSYTVFDETVSREVPRAVLTGDTLFIGDVGRPDLGAAAGYSPDELAGWLYDSLHEKLLRLPDETLVYPAHGAGSFCGKHMSSETVSTIGEQRRLNYALQPMEKDSFVELMTSELPDLPAYFPYTAHRNRENRPTLDELLEKELVARSFEEVTALVEEGAQLLDTRTPSRFAKGHVRGSINVGLAGNYASHAGSVLDPTQPIVLVCDPGREEESAMRLGRIGFDNVVGYLDGGVEAASSDLVQTAARLTADQLETRLEGTSPPMVLDVRTRNERSHGGVEPSLHIPLSELVKRLDEVPTGQSIVVYCAGGYRSSIAASVLRKVAGREVEDLVGGYQSWVQHNV